MTNKADFVNQMYQAGLQAGLTDAAARVMAAQAGIESGYGERAPGYNFFAITKGPDWTGPTISRQDKDANGNPVTQQFRVYNSPQEGIADRISYMDNHFPGFSQAPTVDAALSTLQNGVYGKYYQAPQAKYEKAVVGIDKNYLPPATTAKAAPPKTANVPATDNASNGLKIVDLTNGGSVGKSSVPANPFASTQRNGQIEGVVFHHSGGDGLVGAMTAGQQPGIQHGTGAQFYIDKDGTIYRYAPDTTASQDIRSPGNKFRTDAGKPTAALSNDNTLGVEIVASDSQHFTQAQKDSAAALAKYLSTTYKIQPDMIVGHGDIQGGPGGNKQPTEGVQVAQFARDYIGGKIPPMNIPQVGTELSVTDPNSPPLPRPRPNPDPFAKLGPAAMNGVSRLKPGGIGLMATDEGNVPSLPMTTQPLGAPVDSRTLALAHPTTPFVSEDHPKSNNPALTRALDRLAQATGKTVAPIPMPGRPAALDTQPQVAPTPMPGRPAALSSQAPIPAPAATPQTIHVGQHDYQVGQTFDQGGNHYVVTPTGITSSRTQTNEPTLMGGLIQHAVGDAVKTVAPQVKASVSNTVAEVQKNALSMGNSLSSTATKMLGPTASKVGNSLGTTLAGTAAIFTQKPISTKAAATPTGPTPAQLQAIRAVPNGSYLTPSAKLSSGPTPAQLSAINAVPANSYQAPIVHAAAPKPTAPTMTLAQFNARQQQLAAQQAQYAAQRAAQNAAAVKAQQAQNAATERAAQQQSAPGSNFLSDRGVNTQGMTIGQQANELNKSLAGSSRDANGGRGFM